MSYLMVNQNRDDLDDPANSQWSSNLNQEEFGQVKRKRLWSVRLLYVAIVLPPEETEFGFCGCRKDWNRMDPKERIIAARARNTRWVESPWLFAALHGTSASTVLVRYGKAQRWGSLFCAMTGSNTDGHQDTGSGLRQG